MLEVNYVSAVQATLRDQVATIYNRVGTVKNGERVEVLEREKRFSRVRTAEGVEGWIEQRYLVDQQTYDALQKLTQANLNDPVQAPGVLRNDTNLHITPGRETEHLYQLSAGAKVSVLKRATAEKQPGAAADRQSLPARLPAAKLVQARCSKTGGWCATRGTAWAGCWPAWWISTCRSRSRNMPKASALSRSSF